MTSSSPRVGASQPQVRFLSVLNHVTRAELRGGKRYFDGKEDKAFRGQAELMFIQAMDDGLQFDAPTRTCAVGHQLELELEVTSEGRRPIRFKAPATVLSLASVAGTRELITVRFGQFDYTVWAMVLASLHERQSQVAALFGAMKGDPA